MSFTPFVDRGESVTIDGLTVENGEERVAFYGRLSIGKDQAGLKDAQEMKTIIDALVVRLEGEASLPDRLPLGEKSHPVADPFA
ncbi:hypothetical protein HLH44_20605 [Gluconacetobacter sp. 1c LMG 22058]|uniref:Uncharacterized protein n=1 Tax=Gluconacetobacter dulcium TaxID=2729096 RepID=A0A7W4PMF8_9PROT|nr:hypothetical protein [Gluconacetobacter dulcium]MBB2199796.1 hypothetical protein [Gluconacetobacter dulcium]